MNTKIIIFPIKIAMRGEAIPYFQTHPYETNNSLSSGGPSSIGPRVREKKNRTVEIHESSVMCNQFSLVIMVVSHSMLIPFFPFYGKIPCYHSMLVFFGGCVGKKSSQHASINHHMFIDLKHGFFCKLGASNFDVS